MNFSLAFFLLPKFTKGLDLPFPTKDEALSVAQYLGISPGDIDNKSLVSQISDELSKQNRFLSNNLENESVFQSREYNISSFVREIVENNRAHRRKNNIDSRK